MRPFRKKRAASDDDFPPPPAMVARIVESDLPAPPESVEWTESLSSTRFVPPGRHVVLKSASFDQVRFEKMHLFRLVIWECTLTNCVFSGRFAETGWLGGIGREGRSIYQDCQFVNADLRGFDPQLARFERCVFTKCRLDKWNSEDADFIDCAFPQTSLRDASFSALSNNPERRGEHNVISGNDFSESDLAWARFAGGVDLSTQIWRRDGSVVIVRDVWARVKAAQKAIGKWRDREKRHQATVTLDMLTIAEGVEQRDLAMSRAEIEAWSGSNEVNRAVIELLLDA
jgi:hypothetical protein